MRVQAGKGGLGTLMRGYGRAATWDAYASTLADQLRPWVHPVVLDRLGAYQEACARLVYLVLTPTSEPEAVYATCAQVMGACAAICLAGADALDFAAPTAHQAALAVLEAFTATRPVFETMTGTLPPDVASSAAEKYEEFGQFVAAVATADGQGEVVGLAVMDALTNGIEAVIDGFAATDHRENGEAGVGSVLWNERVKAWARGQ